MRNLGSTKMKKEKVMSTVKETTKPATPDAGGNTGNEGEENP